MAAGASGATIAGGGSGLFGYTNRVTGSYGAIGGGASNSAVASATVAGGFQNNASGIGAFVGGGINNQATSPYATVPGGSNNMASGQFSFAAGQQAQALHSGAFVWADSQNAPFASTNNDSFNVRARGGAQFVTGGAGMSLDGQPVMSSASAVALGQLPAAVLTNGASGVNISGTFTGDGANVTNVNAAALNGLKGTNFWQAAGNNVSAGQFIGSTNNQSVEIRVNNQRALVIGTNSIDAPNIIAGSPINFIDVGVRGSVIAGGGTTNAQNGYSNQISADFSSISGGAGNWIQAGSDHSAIAGGWNNVIAQNSAMSVIVGGQQNVISNTYSFVAGGSNNKAIGHHSVVMGWNSIAYALSFAAGYASQATNIGAFVWADSSSGSGFSSTNDNSFNVRANGGVRFVTGGAGMTVDGPLNLPTNVTFTSSGFSSLHLDNVSFEGNTFLGVAAGSGSALGLGDTAIGDTAMGFNTSGSQNTAVGAYSLYHNSTGNNNTAIGGMALNSALGSGNIAVGYQAGANLNSSEANDIYIGNAGAAGESSTIRIGTPGTQSSTYLAGAINGNGSGVTNLNAAELSAGTLPDARLSSNVPRLNTAQTFTARNTFNQGLSIGTASTLEGDVDINTNTYLFSHAIYFRGETGSDHNHGLAYNGQTITNFGTGNVQVDGPVLWGFSGGALGVMSGGAHSVLSWSNGAVAVTGNVYANGVQLTSDRNAKENFTPLNANSILEKVASLPLTTWNYKQDPAKHIGPMAQDFHTAFGLNGDDDKHISAVDEGGVALAAIQGLNEKVDSAKQKAEIKIRELDTENAALKARIELLESRLVRLEKVVQQNTK